MIRFLVEEAGSATGQNFFVDGGKLMRKTPGGRIFRLS